MPHGTFFFLPPLILSTDSCVRRAGLRALNTLRLCVSLIIFASDYVTIGVRIEGAGESPDGTPTYFREYLYVRDVR